MTNTQQLLKELPSRAASRKAEFSARVSQLKKRRAGDIEAIVNSLHDRAFSEISCIECGNCCRGLGPRLIERDVQKLGKVLSLSADGVREEYLRIDEDGDTVFKHMPCPFLGEDNFCFVYDSRPKACADYPHTDGRQVRGKLGQIVKNSAHCPAVFTMLEMLGEELGR